LHLVQQLFALLAAALGGLLLVRDTREHNGSSL